LRSAETLFNIARSATTAIEDKGLPRREVPLSMAEKLGYGPLGCGRNKLFRGQITMKRNFLMGAAALASLATLSACGGGAGSDANAPAAEATEAAAPAETPAATETPAAAAAPAGGEMTYASFTGDAAAGEKVFAACRTCHVFDEGVNRVGPSLHKVVGRKSGSVPGFSYSDANKGSGVTWTPDVLFEYLEDPKGFMPGTKMAFPGVKDAQKRANLVAYLEAQSK
jgi:cytochrome c